MRRAQRIVALHSEVVLRAIELSELLELEPTADKLIAHDTAVTVALERLGDTTRRLRQECERLAVPA